MIKNLICFPFIACLHFYLFSQPGNLDPSFDTDGRVTFSGLSQHVEIYSTAIQQDGKILIAGFTVTTQSNDFIVLRFHSNGLLDSSFNGAGYKFIDFTSQSDLGKAIAVQPDGKILVAGNSNTLNRDFELARLLPSGEFDSTFSADGKLTVDIAGYHDDLTSLLLQPDGKILLGGSTYPGSWGRDYGFARFNPDGTPDNTFDSDGRAWYPVSLEHDDLYDMALQADGKIVAAGATEVGGVLQVSVMRIQPNGGLDPSFNLTGTRLIDFDSVYADYATAVALQPDGKIVIAGRAYNTTHTDFMLVRLDGAGNFDNSFSNDGRALIDFSAENNTCNALTIQPDGKILVAGSTNLGPAIRFMTARLTSAGVPDSTFSFTGIVTTTFGNNYNSCQAIALQPDGKIIAAGSTSANGFTDQPAIARYFSGIVVSAKDSTGFSLQAEIFPNPLAEEMTLRFSLGCNMELSIFITDLEGKIIDLPAKEKIFSPGMHELTFRTPEELSKGFYLLHISNEEIAEVMKLVKL